jgi:hypothetical protein
MKADSEKFGIMYGERCLLYNEYDGKYYRMVWKLTNVDLNQGTWEHELFAEPYEIETMMGILVKIEGMFRGEFNALLEDFHKAITFVTDGPISAISKLISAPENNEQAIIYNIAHEENKVKTDNDSSITPIAYDGVKPNINVTEYFNDKWGHISKSFISTEYSLPQAVSSNSLPSTLPIGTLWYDLSTTTNS